jgi:hypothetical protein
VGLAAAAALSGVFGRRGRFLAGERG